METAVKPIKFVCRECGGDDVRTDAYAAWDIEKQQWVVADIYQQEYCNTCDGETHLNQVEI